MIEKYPHNYARAEVPDRMGQPFACRCGRYGLAEGVRGSGCPAAMREHIATLEATRSPVLSPAAFDTIVALGFQPGSENPVGWLMGEARRLQTTLHDLRAQIDYIARVGWDASCESAAADVLEAEDATRLNRYAVRVARERDEARAQLATARGTLSALDCRYTGGGVADVSGSHCPLGKPCERCAGEREREEAREEGRREGMEAVAAVLDDGFDPWPAVRRTVNLGAMDERARSGIDAIFDAVIADACREIRALAGAACESEPARVDDVEGDL